MPKTYIYSRRKVRCKGKKDGRNWYWKFWPLMKGQKEPAPLLNQREPAAFESELISLADASLTDLSKNWEETDRKLFPDYCRRLTEKNNLLKKSTQENKELEEAKLIMIKTKDELDAIEEPALSSSWELILIAFCFLVEIPFNSVIFAVFGASKLDTYLYALGTAGFISMLAYFFGKKLKMHPKTLSDKILLIIMPLVAIGVLTVVSILRSVMFDVMKSRNLFKINLDPQTAAIIFVALNFALFLGAMLATYAATRPDHKKYRTRLKKFRDAKGEYKKALRDAEDVTEELADAEEHLAEAKNKRAKTFAVFCEQALNTVDDVRWLVSVYRAANMEARLDGKTPECFKYPPAKILIPFNLNERNISWDCEQLPKKYPGITLN